MADNSTLTRKQRRAIAALLNSRTIQDAATNAGVSERTLYRWLVETTFVLAMRAAEGNAIAEAVRVLITDLATNHNTLRTLRDDIKLPASVRLRAAVSLDDSLLRWRQLLDIETRLTRLEEVVYANN